MLRVYYEKRGWSDTGIPRRSTMIKLGLSSEAELISRITRIED